MSAVYKRLGREDSFITPYTAHKTFTIVSSSFSDSGIKVEKAVSGSFPYTDESLLYAGINQIMFESQLRYTSEHSQDRTLGTSAVVLQIPKQLYGEAIEPGTIALTTANALQDQFTFDVYDRDGVLIESASGNEIGYVNYTLGLCAFTSGAYATTNFDPHQETISTPYSNVALAINYNNVTIPGTADWNTPQDVTVPDSLFVASDVIDWGGVNPDLHPLITVVLQSGVETREVVNIVDNGNGTITITYAGDVVDPNFLTSSTMEFYSVRDGETTSYLVVQNGTWPSDIGDYANPNYAGTPLTSVVRVNDYAINIAGATFAQSSTKTGVYEAEILTYNYVDANYTASFNSSVDISTYSFHCIVEPNELNYTHNPSVLLDDSGSLENYAVDTDFRPYTTAVGVYNSADELLAVGKLAQPTPILPDTPYTFVLQIDL